MSRPAARALRTPLAVAALLVGSILAASCSSDAGSDGATSTTKAKGATTTTRAPIDPGSVDGGKAAYTKALAPVIAAATGLPEADATEAGACLAPKWVAIIGVDGFAAAGFKPDDLQEMGAKLGELRVDEGQAKEMAAGFDACDVDLKSVAVAQLTADPSVPDGLRECLDKAISKASVETGFIDNLLGKEAGSEVYEEAQTCLQPS